MKHIKIVFLAIFVAAAIPANANETIDSVRTTATDAADKTREVAGEVLEKSKEAGSKIWDKMKEVGSSAAEATRDGVDKLRSYTDETPCDVNTEDCPTEQSK
ncbi:hypothetical protein DN730_02465 [Marinomonas piezotolerans]|uniref:YtxH domain-containing protein n=1 Tax=Marinomonas piezotolerans TaxID=2213058 RepID=A0A370UDS5_9GAMM|nr:hypothetical protein [Marinomonas piezotolerans]RDL45933.1 hypothetical protein DN730_02465 [Marinomonas piezotolerans]